MRTCSRSSEDEYDRYFGIVEFGGLVLGFILVQMKGICDFIDDGGHYCLRGGVATSSWGLLRCSDAGLVCSLYSDPNWGVFGGSISWYEPLVDYVGKSCKGDGRESKQDERIWTFRHTVTSRSETLATHGQLRAMNQFKFDYASDIYVLQSAKNDDATDLVALGSDHSVEILVVAERTVKVGILSFVNLFLLTKHSLLPRSILARG